jgi:predicted PurR-regulated permease PerM
VNHIQRSPANRPNVSLLNIAIVVGVLYFAREVLIPFAVAVLFTFVLAPLVIRLRHWHLGKYPAVFAVMTVFIASFALIGWMVTAQLVDLASRLPSYQQNIHAKLKSVSLPQSGMMNRVSKFFDELAKDLGVSDTPPAKDSPVVAGENKPVRVEIHQPIYSWKTVGTVVGSLISPLIKVGIVIVMIMFMLLQREDMRDRLIRLIGASDLNRTTNALDDAARRVSRYLLMQLIVNSSYGAVIGIGLYFMGVPNPILWGVLATFLRFVPYLGIWIAALMPAAVAFAIEPTWIKSFGVIALFFGADIIVFNILEPLLYGASTGISPLAILLAAVLWTWLWGPIGLLLSTPLTVCMAVIGRYAPGLEFLGILLTDKQVLSTDLRFYQRLLAMDLEEATQIGETFLLTHSLDELFDELIVPALILAEEDQQRGTLGNSRLKLVFQNTAFVIEDLSERFDEIKASVAKTAGALENLPPERKEPPVPRAHSMREPVCIIPARDEADELAGQMLAALLRRQGNVVDTFPVGDLVNSLVERVSHEKEPVVCISTLPTRASMMHARHISKRLRAQLPNLKLILGLWRENDVQKQNRTVAAVNCIVVTTLRQAVEQITPLVSTVAESRRQITEQKDVRQAA